MSQPPAHDPWLGNAQNNPQGQPRQHAQGAQDPQFAQGGQHAQPSQAGQYAQPQQAQPAANGQYGQQPSFAAPGQDSQYPGYSTYPGQEGNAPQFGAQSQEPGFLAALFDLKFRSYATPRIISVIYIVSLILIGLSTLLSVLYSIFLFIGGAAIASSPLSSDGSSGFLVFVGIMNLILTPVVAFFSVLLVRMGLEYFSTQFSMAQDLKAMRESASS